MNLPRLLGLDLETTGLDLKKDRILTMGIVIVEGTQPLLEKEWRLWHDTYPESTKEALEAHGIQKTHAIEFGSEPRAAYEELSNLIEKHRVERIIAHNGTKFDFPMLYSNVDAFHSDLRNHFQKIPKIDTAIDLPYSSMIKTRKLSYLAIEHGFMNPFPHSALSDVRTMLRLLQYYSWNEIVIRANSPTITIQANVNYNSRDLAKAAGFHWEAETKRWVKIVKEIDYMNELNVDFEVQKIAEGK